MSGDVRARLEAGEQLVGTFAGLRDPAACEVLGALGFDAVCIDGEHGAMGIETIERLVAATERGGSASALVRVAGNDPVAIATALDTGAAGIVVPRVESGAEAAAAVDAARYPPLGRRGIGPSRAARYGAGVLDYRQRANDELLLAIQVETWAAVQRLDDLLAVEGVDLLFVGPTDLASSMGLNDPAGPEMRETIAGVLERARAAARRTGIFAFGPDDAADWLEAGVNLVLMGSDLTWLGRGARDALAPLRRPPLRP
ncbi:HpcH/HpaI aldolase family protein [Capillimicrobium parvum]|uniref:5-keto-4-deoxy-D-glucarate aldolase n=1 Tax=Capillimicrobium parvum TaxID=2884022 RepID=A0A9E7C0D8_9ACTN|nr:aldolase/citrate lyase family protein [Capillimicrobium parvum]UGS35293.1 5-keto-4-deoxy-D-glucarate aldolase [Capillimicrobium parvum]